MLMDLHITVIHTCTFVLVVVGEIVKIGALKPDMVMDLYITIVGRVKVKVISF